MINHFILRKKNSRKNDRIKDKQSITLWDKKVIVEKNISEKDSLYAPEVRIEKIRRNSTADNCVKEYRDSLSDYQLEEDPDWEFPRDLLELGYSLGEGAFGKVVQGFAHCTVIKEETFAMAGNVETVMTGGELVIMPSVEKPAVVAVKMLQEEYTDDDMVHLVKEMEIMKMIGKHVNIINLLGVCTQPSGHPLLIMVEYAKHGNLRDFLRARRPELVQYLTRQERQITLSDLLSYGWQVHYYWIVITFHQYSCRLLEGWSSCTVTSVFTEILQQGMCW